MSNNILNDFIIYKYKFDNEEFVNYYINFLKSLSLKIEKIPIGFFYNNKYSNFPILT